MAGLISPSEAAGQLGVTDAMLRQLASDRYYGNWLEAPRDDRNYRRYTERDMALLRHVLRAERRGLPHKVIRESLQVRGVDAVLEESLGAEELNPMLQEQNTRLLNEKATLLQEREHWLTVKDALKDEIQGLKDQVREAEAMVNRVRLAGYAFSKDADERIAGLRRNVTSMERELAEAEAQHGRAMENLKEVQVQIQSAWNRLFHGGRLATQLTEAVVRVETSGDKVKRVREDFRHLLALVDGFILGEIQAAVGLPARAGEDEATIA